ncbi:hypothetical protein BH10PSE6_BH10PSE6_21950 [soil metagenome]
MAGGGGGAASLIVASVGGDGGAEAEAGAAGGFRATDGGVSGSCLRIMAAPAATATSGKPTSTAGRRKRHEGLPVILQQ